MKKLIMIGFILVSILVSGAAYAEKVLCCKTSCGKDWTGKEVCTTKCEETYFCN